MTLSFKQAIDAFSIDQHLSIFRGIGRGIEREGLRVLPEGKLSDNGHFESLGSALTHPHITTDYAECLLEFITPVSHSPEESIAQLRDIQKFSLSNMQGELIWPTSMPCFVDNEDDIALAYYGDSNIGKMKTVYRQGLKNRYGSMMQVIAGIHFNFSFPVEFWQTLQQFENNQDPQQDYISAKYFAMLRNYKRYCWVIPYLFGSSPAICPSFLQDKKTSLPFKKSETGYLYLEHATSLRMSDLGYTNSEQSSLRICYNDLGDYLSGLKEAISLDSKAFHQIGVKVNGEYRQLNTNVLQIENELYAPVRPKQVAKSGEKPSEALQRRGVEYIEVRALDVNPFSDTGISLEQIQFLDVFLTYCALKESPELTCLDQQTYEKNMDQVVVRGRDPELRLQHLGEALSINEWGIQLFSEMELVANLLDRAFKTSAYRQALQNELQKIHDPALTPSAQLLNVINEQQKSLTRYTLDKAQTYRQSLLDRPYQVYDENYFINEAKLSHEKQQSIEAEDKLSFDEFLVQYFAGQS